MNALKRILAAVLLLSTLVSLLAACGKDKDKTDETTAETTAAETDPLDADFDLVSTADPTFDYYHSDTSPYLTITEADFNSLRVSVDVTESDVEEYITDFLLPSYRTPIMATDRAVKDGDLVYVYYTGYTDDFPFDGGSNADDSDPYTLVIGSASLTFPGFDTALIGVVPSETSDDNPLTVNVTFPADYADAKLAGKAARFKVVIVGIIEGEATVTDRAVQDGDAVRIWYTGYTDDYAFLGGSNMDSLEPYELEIGSGSFVGTFEEQLIGVIPSETSKENPHTITVTFPENYRNTDLAGKESRFDVVITGIFDNAYSTPELTVEFVTEKLGFETEDEDVLAAFRAELRDQMRQNKVESLTTHKLIRALEELFKIVTFTGTLPEGEAEKTEERMMGEVNYYYQYYNYMSAIYYGSAYFEDLDEAGRWYYGLGPDADWEAYQHSEAERVVKQNLVLNMIARLSGITITEEDAKEWVRDQARSNDVDIAAVLEYYSIEEIYSKIASEKAQQILLTIVEFDYGGLPIDDAEAAY